MRRSKREDEVAVVSKNGGFGGHSPYQVYVSRLRWTVAALGVLVVVLAVALVFIAATVNEWSTGPKQVAVDLIGTTEAVASPAPIKTTSAILVARQRIEDGAQITEAMLGNQEVALDEVPEGALLAIDRGNVIGKFARFGISARYPIRLDDLVDTKPLRGFHIPPGYRAVTINVDVRSGVEGFAKPDSRVDVLWFYPDVNGFKKVATIVRFSRILSVGGATNIEGTAAVRDDGTTATLLVTERDAKIIELARNMGTLSLALVGEEETAPSRWDLDIVSVEDVIRKNSPEDPLIAGSLSTFDPAAGKKIKFLLANNEWMKEEKKSDDEK